MSEFLCGSSIPLPNSHLLHVSLKSLSPIHLPSLSCVHPTHRSLLPSFLSLLWVLVGNLRSLLGNLRGLIHPCSRSSVSDSKAKHGPNNEACSPRATSLTCLFYMVASSRLTVLGGTEQIKQGFWRVQVIVLSTFMSRGAVAVDGDTGGRGSTPVCCVARDKNVEANVVDSFSVMGTEMQVMQGPTGAQRSGGAWRGRKAHSTQVQHDTNAFGTCRNPGTHRAVL